MEAGLDKSFGESIQGKVVKSVFEENLLKLAKTRDNLTGSDRIAPSPWIQPCCEKPIRSLFPVFLPRNSRYSSSRLRLLQSGLIYSGDANFVTTYGQTLPMRIGGYIPENKK